MPIYILGNGGFGRESEALIREISVYQHLPDADLVFLDDQHDKPISSLPAKAPYVCTIADPRARQKICQQAVGDPINLIHPDIDQLVSLDRRISIGLGVIICAQCYFTVDISIGNHCQINTGTHIGHDATLGNFVTISGRVHVCGGAKIQDGAFLGTGAVILPGVTVGEGSSIGAGCIVHRDIAPNTKIVAQPPEAVGFNQPWKKTRLIDTI